MIYAVYINGAYKGCVQGDTYNLAANTVPDKFSLRISDSLSLVKSNL